MVVHFEELWEKAEKISQTLDEVDLESAFYSFYDKKDNATMGKLLLHLCFYSKKFDIDVYSALYKAMVSAQTEMLTQQDA